VGGGIGIAAGAAYACKYRQDGRVAVVFFGDGAINQGVFFETANMAGLWKLPLIYVCERNQFAEFSYSRRFFADEDLSKRAIPFGFPGVNVDGNDLLAVHAAACQAVERARRGEGPTLIVADTYRIEGHTIGDPLTYRVKGEVDEWKSERKDPILRFGSYLVSKKILEVGKLEEIEDEYRDVVKEAVEYALNSPQPELSTLLDDVYVGS
jgi:pyruvate dehydrogenase E1 component alpha subunit